MSAEIKISTDPIFQKISTVIPTVGNTSGDSISHIERAIELKKRGWWDPGEMITHRLTFDDVNDVYDMYEKHSDGVIKVVMSK